MQKKLSDLLVAGAVPNVTVRNKKTGDRVILFAVHFNNESVLLGPTTNRSKKDWLKKCWLMEKTDFEKRYELE